MRVFALRPHEKETFLRVREVHFTEPNREAQRALVKQEHGTDLVWFEDEEPSDQVIELISTLMEQGPDDFTGDIDSGGATPPSTEGTG